MRTSAKRRGRHFAQLLLSGNFARDVVWRAACAAVAVDIYGRMSAAEWRALAREESKDKRHAFYFLAGVASVFGECHETI